MRRLRILKYPWHTAHDYELAKLPHDFFYVSSTHRRWATHQRPVPQNITWIPSAHDVEADVAILHLDQWTFHEPAKRYLFTRMRDTFKGPKIAINHGSNMVDGCSREELLKLLGDDVLMVCNSRTAQQLWDVPRSRFVRHGMTPEEWAPTDYARQEVTIVQAHGKIHAACRNLDGVAEIERHVQPVMWIGRDKLFDSFKKYRHYLQSASVFLQPSYASANPRSRTEAMLTGLAVVTTNSHGEDEYIDNGVNGFASNDLGELIEALQFLLANPEDARRIGRAGRATAQDVFHIDRFVDQWQHVLAEVV